MRDIPFWPGQHVFFGDLLYVVEAIQSSFWEEAGETQRTYLCSDIRGLRSYLQCEEQDLQEAFWCPWDKLWVKDPKVGGNGTTHYYICPHCSSYVEEDSPFTSQERHD